MMMKKKVQIILYRQSTTCHISILLTYKYYVCIHILYLYTSPSVRKKNLLNNSREKKNLFISWMKNEVSFFIFSYFVNSLTPLKMSSTNKMLFMFIISMLGVLLTRIVCPLIIDSIHIKIFDTSMLACLSLVICYFYFIFFPSFNIFFLWKWKYWIQNQK